MTKPLVLVTMGDPAGVGPEVIAKALAEPFAAARVVVVGDARRLRKGAAAAGVDVQVDCVDLDIVDDDLPWGELSAQAGEAAYRFVARATQLVQEGRADAICTAPLNKEALHLAGHDFPGHTELLAHLTGTPEVSMMLSTDGLKVIHVTTHVGLLDAIERIEPGLVGRTIARGDAALKQAGIERPRIAVCAINPHAGEGGLFGRGEEQAKIAPAIQAARADGIDAQGPVPADTAFFRAVRGDFDLVVAMYHDQGHGPVKARGMGSGVNITVGLPVIRTSVDHGTAFDIAGTGQADPSSLLAALGAAAELAG
jgi:4-hydroxythreonine-4-phosphate dehydrogenase